MSDYSLAINAIENAFPGIKRVEAELMYQVGVVTEYPANVCLCNEGDIENVFYILLEGKVEVTKEINSSDARLLKHLQAGDFFGEMGLIHDAPRAATVMSVEPVKVLEIDKASFTDTVQKMSIVSAAMVREVSRRLRENDELAIEDLRLKAGELADAYQQLAELDAARREFLTTIAHELRTPLTSANGYLQMIRLGALEGDTLQLALTSVSESVQRIIQLTNDILFLQEMDLIFSDFVVVDLKALLESCIFARQEYAEDMSVEIRLSVSGPDPGIKGDLESLERAFGAVMDNAIKFSLNGGIVSVDVRVQDSMAIVKITDQGIGIAPEAISRIFDRFWRTEEYDGHLFGGIGLGLAIAKQVVEQHSGDIQVDSQPGRGSTFVIRLPSVLS